MCYDFKSFVQILKGTEPQLNGYCPFHNDRSPSFSCNTETGLWKCHAGCGAGTYEMFLQMFRSGLDYSSHYRRPKQLSRRPRSLQFKLVAEYLYQNVEGKTCLKVKRFEDDTGAKTFSQESFTADGFWLPRGSQEILAPYLYGSWKDYDGPILFVEGEKCADLLSRMRFSATTIPGGVNSWKDTFVPFFQGKIVRILPDSDRPGREFSHRVFMALQSVAKNIRIVELPELLHSGDVWNWFNDTNDRSDDEKLEQFRRLIE